MRTFRILNCLIFLFSIAILALAVFLQWHAGLEPCPLCIMQRVAFIAIAIASLFGLLIRTSYRAAKIQGGLLVLFILAGLFFAGRQLYLQSIPPDQITSCLPDLHILMQELSWLSILKILVYGTTDCGKVTWTFLSLSLAAWAFIAYLMVLDVAILAIYSLRHDFLNRRFS